MLLTMRLPIALEALENTEAAHDSFAPDVQGGFMPTA